MMPWRTWWYTPIIPVLWRLRGGIMSLSPVSATQQDLISRQNKTNKETKPWCSDETILNRSFIGRIVLLVFKAWHNCTHYFFPLFWCPVAPNVTLRYHSWTKISSFLLCFFHVVRGSKINILFHRAYES